MGWLRGSSCPRRCCSNTSSRGRMSIDPWTGAYRRRTSNTPSQRSTSWASWREMSRWRSILITPTCRNDMAKIEVRRLAKGFQAIKGETVDAIHGLRFEVGENEFVSIVGPSGCGKSTLLYIIARFIPPTNGEVLIDHTP